MERGQIIEPERSALRGRNEEILLALNRGAELLQHSEQSEADVFRVFATEVQALGFWGSLSMLDETGERLVTVAVAEPEPQSRLLSGIQRLAGLNVQGHTFALADVDAYRQVVAQDKCVFRADSRSVFAQLLPASPDPLRDLALKVFGEHPILFAPLQSRARVRGVMSIFGAGLTLADVPGLQAFANQLAVALEKALLSERLRALEVRFLSLSEHALSGVTLHEMVPDAEGRPADFIFLEVNSVFERLIGLHAAEIIGRRVTEVLPGFSEIFSEVHERVALTQEPVHFERLIAPLKRRYKITAYSPRRGQFATILSETAERDQSESGKRPQAAPLDTASDAIFMTNSQGEIIWANQAFARVSGYAAEEVIGRNPRFLKSGAHSPEYYQRMWDTILSGQVWVAEIVNRRKDGSLITVGQTIMPLRAESGDINQFISVQQNIDDYRAEVALQESEVTLREVQRIAQLGHYDFDLVTGNWTGSEMLDEILGIDPKYPRTIAGWLEIVHPDQRAEASARLSGHLLVGGDAFDKEYRIVRARDAAVRWIHDSGKLELDRQGQPHRLFGIIQDVTQRRQSESALEVRLRRLAALRAIDSTLISSLDLQLTFSMLLNQISTELVVDAVDVLLYDPHLQTLECAAARGFRSRAFERSQLQPDKDIAARVVLERRQISIPDLEADHINVGRAEILESEAFRAYYATPLIAKGQLLGLLEVFHRAPLTVDRDWMDFFETLARQTASAIENLQLFERLQRSSAELALAYDATIESWSRVLDLRDKEAEGHTQRVAEITVKLARLMGISGVDLLHIRRGALLHDIGKMGVPDLILQKPDKLTSTEWVIMRKHPQLAIEMLESINYLRPALDIPAYHHEWWDGSGYPRGLRAEQIPIAARIFAVADVWDAVRSERPYRKAWTVEQALEHIKQGGGKQFDPKVVDVFLALQRQTMQL